MVSSRQTIACILLSLGIAACVHAQTASISGKVIVKNKGVPGIVVVAVTSDHNGGAPRPRHRGTTDDEGNYRISDIGTGNYFVYPLAPALAAEKAQEKRLLTIA